MNVLVTGAFGNLGRNAVRGLVEKGHHVRCFDLKTNSNEESAWKIKSKLRGQIDFYWGDIRSADDVAAAVKDQDVVVHLCYIMPPGTDDRPEWAEEINIGGTKNVIDAL